MNMLKVAIVTGAGQGIGRAIAVTLASRGHDVTAVDIDAEAASETVSMIKRQGQHARFYHADVADRTSVQAMIAAVEDAMGPCAVLVNNAGWEKVEPFLTSQAETWDRIIDVNLRGTINVCFEVGQHMVRRKSGRVINIASDAGRVGSKGEAVYSGTKGGIIAFSKAIAREWAQYGITVNTVCPGPTDTALLRETAQGNPRLIDAMQKSIPLHRIGTPDDIAHAVAFFATEEAEYITGQVLSVSGGLTMVG